MKIKLTKDNIPDYPGDKDAEPIEVEGGITIRLGMEYDDNGGRLDEYGKPVRDSRPDVLWGELLDSLAGEIEDQFCHGIDNEATVGDTDFDFSYYAGGAPGMFIDSSDGWSPDYYYLPMKGSNCDDGDYSIEERRRWLHADARLIRGAWRGDWYYVYCFAEVSLDGIEVGRGGFGTDTASGDEYLLEVYGEALAEALAEAKKEVSALAEKLAGGNPLAELEVES